MLSKRGVLLAIVVVVVALIGLASDSRPEAQAQGSFSALTFSSGMTSNYEPTGLVGIEFPSGNDGVYVTFTFNNLPPGSGLSRIVRVDKQDYNWDKQHGALNCCSAGGSGRYGFPIVQRTSGDIGDLPGGAYEVILYLNGAEAAKGGFGIRGTGGLDDNDNNDNDGGDDDDDDDDD